MKRFPLRGEIWYVRLPTDPPDKAARPVIIVSLDSRNRHPAASTVMVAPLTGSVEKPFETHIPLSPGETGLHPSSIRCEDLTVVKKEYLIESKAPLRRMSHTRICQIADMVRLAMGCPPK
jgi:mRNA-degrading endonuclease toxin of MazEF toxin-antitoxin module